MEKEFKIFRSTNGRGHNNLLAIVEECVPDIYIGTVIIVPYAQGFIDPVSVILKVDEQNVPIKFNDHFADVVQYVYAENVS